MRLAPRIREQSPWLVAALVPLAVLAWIASVGGGALQVWHLGPPDRAWLYTLTWSKRPAPFLAMATLYVATAILTMRAIGTGAARPRRAAMSVGAALVVVWLTVVAAVYPWGDAVEHAPAGHVALRYAPAITLEMGALAGLGLVLLLACAELRSRRVRALIETSLVGAALAWAALALRLRAIVFMRWSDPDAWWLDAPVDGLAWVALALTLTPVVIAVTRARRARGTIDRAGSA